MGHQDIKSRLLARRLGEDVVDVDGVGPVRVRGLNRDESIRVGKEADPHKRDRIMLSCGMVDPAMTEEDVAAWQLAAPGGEIEDVSRKIAALSKLTEEAPKGDV